MRPPVLRAYPVCIGTLRRESDWRSAFMVLALSFRGVPFREFMLDDLRDNGLMTPSVRLWKIYRSCSAALSVGS